MIYRFAVIGAVALLAACTCAAEPLRFAVTIAPESFGEPFTGRVVVWLSRNAEREPRFGPNWFHPEPCYSAKSANVKPGEAMMISNDNAVGFPGKLDELPPGQWTVQ